MIVFIVSCLRNISLLSISSMSMLISLQMSFPVFHNKSFVKFGRRFACDLIPYLEKFELLSTDFYENSLGFQVSIVFNSKFNLIFKDNEVVFVTYASGNHFAESKMGIHTLRTNNFTNKIIFYDLGLSLLNIEELQGVCNLEIRVFNYTAYPKFVRNLYGYHFKPIIIADIFREFKAFWIIDASARFKNLTNWKRFNHRVRSGAVEPFALRHPSSHSIFAATHNEMYNYLPLSASIARNYSMFDANTMFVVRSDFAKEAVKWNLLCALTKECMDPPRSKLGCNFTNDRFGVSAGCHRYDQSCINVIVASLKHRLGLPYQGHNLEKIRDSFDKFASVKRGEDMARKLQHFKC
ncbi:hypothetical protein WR25_05554 isoform B [Diploscapter pachys]|uniref:Nucleotide-diphospho-sugar transferase domain-containing protein n=1 Tax=Diploscapter pachys TaxID=2018661 RepID=A0A2A2L5X0_9BILA|nr:hypothetical protein WR25_05554 isoform A [Diploscapter pachys]PAV81661.1 hypothetical protein WR25_05554 isoform B [Diploscapter pachys]